MIYTRLVHVLPSRNIDWMETDVSSISVHDYLLLYLYKVWEAYGLVPTHIYNKSTDRAIIFLSYGQLQIMKGTVEDLAKV